MLLLQLLQKVSMNDRLEIYKIEIKLLCLLSSVYHAQCTYIRDLNKIISLLKQLDLHTCKANTFFIDQQGVVVKSDVRKK